MSTGVTIPRRALIASAVVVASLVISLLALELAMRALVRSERQRDREIVVIPASEFESYPYTDRGQSRGSNRMQADMTYDPFLGYVPTADASGKGFHTNAQHLRYDEDLGEKAEQELRVVVTGGSVAWGSGVAQGQTYAAVLEELLAQEEQLAGWRVRVLPAGVSAWVSTQERNFLLGHLLDLEPDVVVMFSGANDIYHGYRGDRLLRNQDYLGIRRQLEASRLRYVDPGRNPALVAGEDAPVPWEYRSKLVHRLALVRYNLTRDDSVRTELLSMDPQITIAETLRNVHTVVDATRRAGVDFVYYMQPYLATTNKELADFEVHLMERAEHFFPGWPDYVRRSYPQLRARLEADAAEVGYAFVDADVAVAGERESVFIDDFHFGDRGNRLVAEHMRSVLLPLLTTRVAERVPVSDALPANSRRGAGPE